MIQACRPAPFKRRMQSTDQGARKTQEAARQPNPAEMLRVAGRRARGPQWLAPPGCITVRQCTILEQAGQGAGVRKGQNRSPSQ